MQKSDQGSRLTTIFSQQTLKGNYVVENLQRPDALQELKNINLQSRKHMIKNLHLDYTKQQYAIDSTYEQLQSYFKYAGPELIEAQVLLTPNIFIF